MILEIKIKQIPMRYLLTFFIIPLLVGLTQQKMLHQC